MSINSLAQRLRLPALVLFSGFLLSCGVEEGEQRVIDPLFAECRNCPLDPPVLVAATLVVLSENHPAPVIPITSVTNSITFTGNDTPADLMSMAIPAFEGCSVLEINYNDTGSSFGGAVLNFGSVDLSAFDTLHFTVDTSAIPGFTDLTIQMEPPGGGAAGTNVLLSGYVPVATSGNYRSYEIPLADFTATNFSGVANLGFWNVKGAGGALAFGTLYVDDIYYTAAGGVGTGGGGCSGGGGGQLLTNGGFEAGNLSSWAANDNGGSITAVDTQDSGSTWSASVVAGVANNPSLSQVNLAMGTVNTGDPIDIAFDMCGTLANGSEVAVAVLSEFGIGIGADRQELDRFANIPDVWTRYNYQGLAGANVAGGVSVQFDVICGGAAGCAADVFFDNVSATIGGGMVPGTASGNSCVAAPPPVTGAVFDDAVDAQWLDASIAAFDQAIGFSNCVDDDGAACPSIGWSVVPEAGRGNVIEVTYATTTDFAGLIVGQTIAGLDFSSFAGGNIVFDLNVTNNPTNQPFRMKIDCVGCPTNAGQREQDLGVPGAGWQTITVAVDDIVNANGGPTMGGLVLGQTTTGLVIFPPFGQTSDIVYRIDNIRWEAAPPPPPPVSGAVFDDAVDAQWVDASIAAFDQAIGFSNCVDDDGAACPSIGWSVVPEAGRGNVIEVTYATTTDFAGLIVGQTIAGLDFSSFAGGNIVFDLNVTNNPTNQPFRMKIDCVGCPTNAGQREQDLGVPGAGWQTITVAVDDIVNANGGPTMGGLVLGQTTTGLVIFPPFGQTSDISYRIDNIRWEAAGGGGGPTNIAENGGFESGDFTDWVQFESAPGNQTVNMTMAGDTSSEGSFHAQIDNLTPGTNSLIKQERKGVGVVAPGIAWTVTFDARGSLDPVGAVAFAEVFCETAAGNETCGSGGGILGGAPLSLNPDPAVWKSFMFSGTAGPTTESLTLQLGATTGGGTFANMFYDNITMTVGP